MAEVQVGPKIGPYDHLTRSKNLAKLMELFHQGTGETIVIPYTGDHPHDKTKHLRRSAWNKGYVLVTRYERTEGRILAWLREKTDLEKAHRYHN